jgi:hypothetical protein
VKVKNLCNENCKTLRKEIGEDLRWEDFSFSCISRINIVKMSTLPKAIKRLNVILIKIPVIFFTKIEK